MTCLYKFFYIALAFSLFSCNLPKDPEKTLETVNGDTLKVGIIENPPWTNFSTGKPTGVEVKMVEAIADSLNAVVQWFKGSSGELFEALQAKELHLVIGGITKGTPWSKHIGLTNSYKVIKIAVGVPPRTAPPDDINEVRVGVIEGSALAEYVRKKGGQPVNVAQLKDFKGPIAAAEWKLQRMGYQITDIKLHEIKNVFAVIAGENAWVMFLENFFNDHKKQIDRWLNKVQNEESRAI